MPDFLAINRIFMPKDLLLQTGNWLRSAGNRHAEAFVLWAGVFQTRQTFVVTTSLYPEQTSLRSSNGVGVHVSGDELFRIGKWLYDNKRVLIAQVHSHPGKAFHSDTDDSFPMVTAIGQFSVVVPDFAKNPLVSLFGCAIYRLNEGNKWVYIDRRMTSDIFQVVNNGAS